MSENESYGDHYYCVKTPLSISENKEIYLMADFLEVFPDGSLAFFHNEDTGRYINLLLSSGEWNAVYAASILDGHAVAIEHWKGELIDE